MPPLLARRCPDETSSKRSPHHTRSKIMAKSTDKQERHKFWTCELTPSPARVYPNERLSLLVTLFHPRLAEWSSDNDEEFLKPIRRISFSSTDHPINALINSQT